MITAEHPGTVYPPLKGTYKYSTVGGVTVVLVECVQQPEAIAYEAAALKAAGWENITTHAYKPVAEAWFKARTDDLSKVQHYSIGETVTSWHGTNLDSPAIMTRRDDVKIGDTIQSSGYGKRVVHGVGSRGLTTTIAFENGLTEIYDRDLLVPRYPVPCAL